MKRQFRLQMHNELYRMIKGKQFKISLFIGIGISLWHFFQHVLKTDVMGYGFPTSAYIRWIGADAYEMQSYWYYLILPLLAVFPFAGTMFTDLKSGYANQIFLRSNRETYFKAKFMITFLSGGLCCVVPLVINFLLTATVCPLHYPDLSIGIGPAAYCIGSRLYYMRPFLYWILYMCFDFVMCGSFAVAALVFSFFVDYQMIALLLPFGIYYFLFCFGGMLGTEVLSANYFLIPGVGVKSSISIVASIGMCTIVVVIYVLKGKTYEAAGRL